MMIRSLLPAPAPHAFRQFILKVASRCDLACDHCYVYEMADQRWRGRPRVMPRPVVDATAARIGEHARTHGLDRVDVVLHGGEPLLAGVDELAYCAETLRSTGVEVGIAMQTNGVLLTEPTLDALRELDVSISVSLDGTRTAHDRHRRRAGGQGSYDAVRRGLLLLTQPRYRPMFRGLLCTVDLRNDPLETYAALLEFAPPTVDLLLPHGNWENRPPGIDLTGMTVPYADWLIAVFDRWYHAPRAETSIRRFEEMINVLLGGQSGVEGVGLAPAVHVVVETDGAIEQSDMLSSTYEGAAATGLHVLRDTFDDALRVPEIADRQRGALALSAACRSCSARDVCGGGLLPHRYAPSTGFENPSVFCHDLYRLTDHIRETLAHDLKRLHRTAG